ncbi:MAG: glycosyltransferase [Verrucomicrobiota bacterium]
MNLYIQSAMIAIFATTLDENDGGISRSIPSLFSSVGAAGGDVILVYPDFGNPLAVDPSSLSFPSIRIPMKGWWHNPLCNAIGLRPVLDQLKALGVTIFHHGGIWTATNHLVARYARANGIGLVCSPRGMLDTWAMSYKSLKKQLCWNIYAHRDLASVNLFHATSDLERSYIQKLGFEQEIVTIPNGVEVPCISDLPEKPRQEVRKLLFLSRVHPKKGIDLLIKAWAQVKPLGWRVQVAGPDEENHTSEMMQLALKLGVKADFDFLGNISEADKWSYFRKADAFVLPTYAENFGIVVAEALACETPVLTTDSAPWGFLDEEGCGWSVTTNVEGLIQGLQCLNKIDRDQLKSMGQRGRKFVKDKYSWKKIGEDMLAAYQKISV